MARPWSDDEVKLLRKLIQSKTQREIAERLGRSMKSVEKKLHRMRSKKPRIRSVPAWSEDELELLNRLFPIKTAQEVAERIGRSVRSVRSKAYKMGLQRKIAAWSKDEVKLLKELYSHESKTVIAHRLGRSLPSITGKAHKLGLKRSEVYRHWSERELNLLRKLFSHRNRQLVAGKLGRSVSSVTHKAYELGLKKTKKPTKSAEQY